MVDQAPPLQVMTVTGALDAAALGVTDSHEHLFLRSPALPGSELEDVEKVTDEVAAARGSGLQSFVELTPIGLGRRPDTLRQVSAATGAPIIAATGYHRDAHYRPGHWVLDATDELLFARMLADLEVGMHPADWTDASRPPDSARAGVIKVGASYQHISAHERRRLLAATEAARVSGVAIVCHTEVGTCGAEVADLVEDAGIPLDQLVLAHMDRNPDADVHRELLGRGVYLVYDTPGRIKYQPDSVLIQLIEDMVTAGFGAQLLLGLDLGRSEYWRSYGGGPGLGYLMQTFVPRLERRIGSDATRAMLAGNPPRAFAMRAVG